MNIHPTGSPSAAFATRSVAAAALFTLFTGCCHDEDKSCSIANLPEESFVSNLTGHSNTGLWNRRLGLGLKNESDVIIHVDRTIPFEKLRRGDIIVFTQPGAIGFICHPVVATGDGWVKTKGHFNAGSDAWPVTRSRYAGRVDLVADAGGQWKAVGNLHDPVRAGNRGAPHFSDATYIASAKKLPGE